MGWWAGPADEALGVTGAKFLKTLDSLSDIDSLFVDWQVNRNWEIAEDGQPRLIPLGVARKRIEDIVATGVARDDFNEPEPIYGYSVLATAGARGPRRVAFMADTGSQNCELSFGEHYLASDLSIVTYPLFKAALLTISTVWDVKWAYANARRNEFVKVPTDLALGVPGFRIDAAPQVPVDSTFPKSMFAVPWIIYLSARHAAGVRVGDEIQSEHTPDGGLVMSATADRLDPTNPQHVRAARILAETLIACRSG
jgi:hypothetical protein